MSRPSRRRTRQVRVGPVLVGGGAPVSVQGMIKTDTRDVPASLAQIEELARAGAEIVRVAVPDEAAAKALAKLVKGSPLPVVADIHFSYRLALMAVEAGVAKLRINPGNIGARWKVKEVARAARDRGIPIRIGVNAGSLERDLAGMPTTEAMVQSALRQVALLEDLGCADLVVSLKASDVPTMVQAYRTFAARSDVPLHLGVTEAGTRWRGSIRSAVGIGSLLLEGIGDTLRVSLTGETVEEIRVGREILAAVGLLDDAVTVIACPTCGRCQVNVAEIAAEVERRSSHLKGPLKVAVMGCAVNGPGEAREADVGVAGGRGAAVLFRRGERVRNLREDEIVEALMQEIEALSRRR